MKHAFLALFVMVGSIAVLSPCSADEARDVADSPTAILPPEHLAVFKKYCFDCHDAATSEAGVNLEDLTNDLGKDIETAERWQKILNAVNSGEMPPQDSDPISDADKTAFLDALSVQMVHARKILSDTGGVVTLRRLNRREYQNTIETLLGVRPDVSSLPDDQATAGFDTSGASLFFSSDQWEQYLATAKTCLEWALLPRRHPSSRTVRIEPEEEYTPHYAQMAADLLDKVERSRAWMAEPERPTSDFGILDAYQAKKQLINSQKWYPQIKEYLDRPETQQGATLILTIKGGGPTKVKFPTLGPQDDGKYQIRLRAAAYPDAPERFHYVEFTSGFGSGRKHLGWRKVTAGLDQPEVITFPIEHHPGERFNLWIHQRTHQDRGDKNLWTLNQEINGMGTPPGVWIDWAELVGPEPVAPTGLVAELQAAAAGQWDDDHSARVWLRRFATDAFRGTTPDNDYLDRLVDRYAANRAGGQSPIEALIDPLSIILSSPSFLYQVESATESASPWLTGPELAVRLSYFLWSAPPDEELMAVARQGMLRDPHVLKTQTARLLADPRSDQFVRGFVHQWLQMERLDMFQFNGAEFPTFDNAVRANAREEIYQTVHHLIDHGLPLGTLLKSDFVVINDLLAGYYGIGEVADGIGEVNGHEFRKVSLPDGSLRGGLLGTAAVLAMGSDGLRSSPVERGAWVLRHLIHDAPPPAPPNVPQLSRLDGQVLSARELGRAHQEQPQCAQCHRKIDPIGYGLENFDAAGRWRDVETVRVGKRKQNRQKTFAIDPSGQLPDGRAFEDYFGLRDAVALHVDDFARGLTESLIEYGMGRPYGFTDQDLADEMIRATKPAHYRIDALINALVQSSTFQSR